MNLAELRMVVNAIVEHLPSYQNSNDIPVLISLSENSMGARASSGVCCAGMGFDWERGQFRIEPTNSLVKQGHNYGDAKDKICREYDGRKYYMCPRCEQTIAKKDKFCKTCGQKLD